MDKDCEWEDQRLYNQLPQQVRGMTVVEIYHELTLRRQSDETIYEWEYATPLLVEALRLRNGILYQQYMLERMPPPD